LADACEWPVVTENNYPPKKYAEMSVPRMNRLTVNIGYNCAGTVSGMFIRAVHTNEFQMLVTDTTKLAL